MQHWRMTLPSYWDHVKAICLRINMHTLEVPENAWRLGLAIAPAPVKATQGLGGELPEWGELPDNRFWILKNNCN